MKEKLIILLLVLMLAVAGCSSGGNSGSTPADKLVTINTMMAKGYEMSENQRQSLDQVVADGKKLLSEGKTAEAGKLLDEAIKMLEVIAETDRFNKSE